MLWQLNIGGVGELVGGISVVIKKKDLKYG